VLVIGERSPRHKRRYVTMRIPHSVLERVHHRLSSKSSVR
jgi:predicted DNA binding CopG/RHH family protein